MTIQNVWMLSTITLVSTLLLRSNNNNNINSCNCCFYCNAFTPTSNRLQLQQRRSSVSKTTHRWAQTTTNPAQNANSHQRSIYYNDTEIQRWIDVGRQELQGWYGNFQLDDWQLQAGGAIWDGHNVIVSAPTGAGKTIIGEMALHIAFQQMDKTGIYTTPLKALSNQKYMELSQTFGRNNTGLSTGDLSINKGARITIMTTEVYRNIAWRSSSSSSATTTTTATATATSSNSLLNNANFQYNELKENAVVILDEFHYMGLPGRGGVWEESIIVSPTHTQIIGLSATLSNAASLVAWMEYVTGRRTILIQVPNSQRPVPLRYLFATKDGVYPLFREKDAGPGAPLGLLGYRGDGIPPLGSKKKRGNSGFDPNLTDDDDFDDAAIKDGGKLPKGLQVNPALRDAAARRLDRVNRAIERIKIRSRSSSRSSSSYDNDWDTTDSSPRNQVYKAAKRLNAKEEQKERERLLKKEMRRAVPSMYALMIRLQQKELLPAIFFIFSRNGCDEAARMVYRYLCGSMQQSEPPSSDFDNSDTVISSRRPQQQRRNGRAGKPTYNSNGDNKNSGNGLISDSDGRMFRPGSNYLTDDMILASTMYEASPPSTSDQVVPGTADDGVGDNSTPSSVLVNGKWEYYAQSGLLTYNQVREAAYRISLFNNDNAEIAFDDDLIEQYLFGIGSHHAGMLPAHKSFVEFLFRNQLLKVVFATETLAAGINMPARTTVICSMAKRVNGGSSMALLDTSNLLQMAGRAGRRGMDTDGTCVLVATPFETHDDAVKILTDPILPISSQFSPSYSLCVNLIARGGGELTVAKQLVSKSFAMWERRQAEDDASDLVGTEEDLVNETLQAKAHDHFVRTLADIFKELIFRKTAKYDISRLEGLYEVLSDLKLLKKTSKSFVGTVKMLEIETVTLAYLEKELASTDVAGSAANESDEGFLREIYDVAKPDLIQQIGTQRIRAANTEREVSKHPFTAIAAIASLVLTENSLEASRLAVALTKARGENAPDLSSATVSAEELSSYAKSAVVLQRKTRKLVKANPDIDPEMLLDNMVNLNDVSEDAWDDFLSITKTLVAYGCLSTSVSLDNVTNFENISFELTPAGVNIGMLSFDNSLWALNAMGGAWDVTGASSELDELNDAMTRFDEDYVEKFELEHSTACIDPQKLMLKPQEEADALVSLLRRMSPSELSGYVSSFISDDSRGGGGGSSVVEMFQSLTLLQQQVVQKSLCSMERLVEVQKLFSIDEGTRNCNFDISNCEVVTAWAAGCSWSEAVEISGSPPGDLARVLSRVLDAMRQFGSLPFTPVRRREFEQGSHTKLVSCGLDQEVRRLCREASRAINRYPLKDPLSFTAADEEDKDEDELLVPSMDLVVNEPSE